jgi:hypothetical protein
VVELIPADGDAPHKNSCEPAPQVPRAPVATVLQMNRNSSASVKK